VRDIDNIDEPKWTDLYDREAEIRRLKQEIEELKADLADARQEADTAKKKLKTANALLGVP
jgi:hypothetical protein